MTAPTRCPLCQQPLVLPVGPARSPLGILSEFPGDEELRQLIPFAGGAGRILKKELWRVSLAFDFFRVTNVWMHPESKKPGEYDWHFASAVRALRNCRAILVLGSTATEAVFDENVMTISGLTLRSPEYFPNAVVVAGPNPANLIWGTVGEFRLALERFSKLKEVKGVVTTTGQAGSGL